MIEITPTECRHITEAMCQAFLKALDGVHVTVTDKAAMKDYERDAYQMGAEQRRKVMEGRV